MRIHAKCKKQMKPIPVRSHMPASEWYCEGCHASEQMSEEDAVRFIQLAGSMERAAKQGQEHR